ncbi:MAG: FdhF/YdeP family oxidoreductase [Verrucomicrobia bacterium]|nr:FdhF/YdeP family oxidoreductase [Verrucomicrobiota bacterium]
MPRQKVWRSVRAVPKGWIPRLWASPKPFGVGEQHPNNFAEVFRAAWENRDRLGYAYRILDKGVCDGCSLGTSGMKDWTVTGIHLCNVRLRLLRLNTMAPMNGQLLEDVAALRSQRSRDLRALGRLPYPLARWKGQPGFRRISWEDALKLIADKIRAGQPDRNYFYLTSRGIPNETYYAAQKAVRAIGTNNIDNAARVCHSPSTFALKAALGVAATTCSYADLIGTDLVVFFGSNVANNQPVIMKYLYYARKAGTKVVVVNPYREPAMERYWIPSDVESAVFGTKIAEHFFQVQAGGDLAFLNGTLKHLVKEGRINQDFIRDQTVGFAELKTALEKSSWKELERASGVSKQRMLQFARLVSDAERAVFVWGMGITQHPFGEENVQAIINLALAKGFVGREGCGLMPIRGHSGVQGGAEMGAYATAFPGGPGINEENAAKFSQLWGFEVPGKPGLTTADMFDVALQGGIDLLWSMGGDFREIMPDPAAVEEAFRSISLRVHQDIVLSSQMLVDPAETVVLLPATTRYEIAGGVTETSTERRVIFSPEIPGPRVNEARSEWEVFLDIARRVKPELGEKLTFANTAAIRQEIARVIPAYKGIEYLTKAGDSFQIGGPRLCAGSKLSTPDGKAHFKVVSAPRAALAEGLFRVVTRRGKQFNSMVHEDVDASTNALRRSIFMNPEDARRLALRVGDRVRLYNDFGSYIGEVLLAPVTAGTLEVYWPEGNVLINPQARSPLAKIPAYKEITAALDRDGAREPEPILNP